MKIRWLKKADGRRAPGYEETVDDHLGLGWIARGDAEEVKAPKRAAVQTAVIPKSPEDARISTPSVITIPRGKH